MRDMILLSGIVLFWFLFTFGTSSLVDSIATDVSISANTSLVPDIRGIDNFTVDDIPGQVTGISYLNMLKRIFTFRIPDLGVPNTVGVFISFFNYFLVLLLGLIIYRLVRSGSG